MRVAPNHHMLAGINYRDGLQFGPVNKAGNIIRYLDIVQRTAAIVGHQHFKKVVLAIQRLGICIHLVYGWHYIRRVADLYIQRVLSEIEKVHAKYDKAYKYKGNG